jgi:thiosulfate/3-mercaptopyruvate sulfurtransferase
MHPLISTTELASQIEHAQGASPNYLIFDCRFALLDKQIGHREYLAGHIPGAQYADLEAHLSAPAGKNGRHPLPNQDLFVAQLGRWGINKNTTVVC